MSQVKVYGADWCSMTRRMLAHLDNLGIPYEYIDVERNPQASQWVKDHNDGKERKPTIEVGGRVLSEPTSEDLEELLRAEEIIP